jgi:glycosyltransferase involved in cell wall biosynthesis
LYKSKFGKPVSHVRFVIIGDGALRNALETQANSLGLKDDVIFTGSRRDLENVYPGLDIVALTSRNEGTPLTLIEAMANARSVISTAVGGVIDLLGKHVQEPGVSRRDPAANACNPPFEIRERGIGVLPNDADAFAAGLARLVEDATLRRESGARGLQFVTRQYSKERLLTDIEALYKELVR